ncbi:MAG TPA: MMPL family transporter, partial [Pirellulales bacterium]
MKEKSTFFSRNGLRIVLVAVFLLPPTFLCAAKAFKSNKNDVQDWLPANYKETREFAWFQRHFAGEQFVLASWDGCTLDDQRLRLFVEKLVPSDRPGHAAHGFFQSVVTGPMLLAGLKDQLKLTDAEALQRLEGALIGPVLPPEGKPASPADRLSGATAAQAEPARQTGVVVTLSEAGKHNLRGTIHQLWDTAAECNIPHSSFHMGGPPIDNYAIDSAGENSLVRLAGIALVIGVVISWMCLRSVLLTVLVFIAGIYSAALSLALTRVLPTDMNAILLTMPPLVFVAGISGAIHLANYYRDLVHEQGPAGAPGKALHHAALPLGLATGTTAVGLVSLCYSDLVPIQQFGIYSAVGVVASLLLLCLFLPAGFQLWPLTPSAARTSSPALEEEADAEESWGGFWWPVARFIVDRHVVVAAAGIALLAFFGWGCTRITTSVQMMRMFKSDAPILADYKWLEKHLGPLVPMEVVLKIDPRVCRLNMLERIELVQKVQQHVEQLDVVGSALSAATFAPRLPEEKDFKRSSRGIFGAVERIAIGRTKQKYELARAEYNKRLEEHRANFYGQGYVALEKLPGADGALAATGCELWRISARISALKDVDFGQFVNNIRAEVEPILAAEPHGGLGIEAKYTGLVPLIYKAQHSLLDGLLLGFIMDLVVVSIIMTLSVREWSAGIVMALPAIFPVMIVFGFMGLVGIVVDTGTVMAPGVALGVTVDDVVHFMLMYRNGLKQGLSRRDSIMLAYKGCARPMFQSWGVIGLGMSVFAMSPFTPTQRFGYLMVTLLTAALVGNLVVLPAVLASPLGALFGRRFHQDRQRSDALPGVDPAHAHE